MDRHSEVEAKFEADGLTPGQVQAFVDGLPARGYWRCRQYLKADGVDTFYRIGEGVFRSRRDDIRIDRRYDPSGNWEDRPERVDCCLTVKQRKSDRNLLDRHEVDLHAGPQDPEDVRAFVGLLGGTEVFRITKTYDVWMLQCGGFTADGYRATGTELCLALYDAARPDGSDRRRFLEIEVEKHSTCSTAEGHETLKGWIATLRKEFELGAPVNTSLQELYAPKEQP